MQGRERNLKQLLGNPKIVFVLGGPASGKGTQCAKLVEEFGYTHISTGDLMRAEVSKGTKQGEQIKKIVAAGGLVPFQLTVELLINALISTPSKSYLIDGFPRAVDQAIYFEKNVVEAHQILYYDLPKDLMAARMTKRAETSGRSDDNPETMKTRVQNYFDQTLPVVDFYKKFGKVSHIDATGSIAEVYAQSKRAVLPQCMCLLGPKASGKTSIGNALSKRTNAKLIDFNAFLLKHGLHGQDDEVVTTQFIQTLAREVQPRLVLENFPQNVTQAKYFVRNGTTPSNIFSLRCSKDMCQERMIDLGQEHPQYVSSSILSKKIKQYYDNGVELLPYLKEKSSLTEIDTDQAFDKTMASVYKCIEPLVIHVRPGTNAELKHEIITQLGTEHGFVNLDVEECIKGEHERGTVIGQQFYKLVGATKVPPADLIVRMLNKIIYCGQESLNKFILSNFPGTIEQAKVFEQNCAQLSAMIYPTSASTATVEIKNNDLTLFNIDSLMAKQFRLKTMSEWNHQLFEEKLGNKVEFGLMVGKSNSGKSTLAKLLAKNQGYTVLDMKAATDRVKASLGTEEEPFEGAVPIAQVEKSIIEQVKATKATAAKAKFVFDGFTHESLDGFLKFTEQFGLPDFLLFLTADEKTIKERYAKKNEMEDFPEDQLEVLQEDSRANRRLRAELAQHFEPHVNRVQIINQPTDASIETTTKELNNRFSPKVILVNHVKSLPVDTTCANIAIKYNMVYVSAYQVLKHHIQSNTEWGKKLQASRCTKEISQDLMVRDEFNEAMYSPIHYDLPLVMELLKETITEKRTNQKFVLLEGLCNKQKLAQIDDQLQLRYMDEFFNIELIIGEVAAVIGFQYEQEADNLLAENYEYEVFPEPPPVEEKPKRQEGEEEEEEEAPEEPPEDGEEKKAPAFQPEKYKWTISNRKPKNLPQLYNGCKGIQTLPEVKHVDPSYSKQHSIAQMLDDFCGKLQDSENSDKYHYLQVIFPR